MFEALLSVVDLGLISFHSETGAAEEEADSEQEKWDGASAKSAEIH